MFCLNDTIQELKEKFDIMGNTLIHFLAESYMGGWIPISSLCGKYEATASKATNGIFLLLGNQQTLQEVIGLSREAKKQSGVSQVFYQIEIPAQKNLPVAIDLSEWATTSMNVVKSMGVLWNIFFPPS